MTRVTAREFNRSPSAIKELARNEPVFVTERGQAAFVLLSLESYEELRGAPSVHDSLRMDDDCEIDFEPAVSRDPIRAADL